MPAHSLLPDPSHKAENLLADALLRLDDGKLHLWFDLSLPGVPEIDLFVWDEECGVFCIEVKGVTINFIERITLEEVDIWDRKTGLNPVKHTHRTIGHLMDFMRKQGMKRRPWITGTAFWPKILRNEWCERFSNDSLPLDYEKQQLFKDDIENGLPEFRERLDYISQNPPFGKHSSPYKHDPVQFERVIRLLPSRVAVVHRTEAEVAETVVDKEITTDGIGIDNGNASSASPHLPENVTASAANPTTMDISPGEETHPNIGPPFAAPSLETVESPIWSNVPQESVDETPFRAPSLQSVENPFDHRN